jgi:hypothetical protein
MTKPANPKKSGDISSIPDRPIYGPQRTALESTIAALESDGRLAGIDRARVEICRGLATMLDAEPESAALWREYRAAEKSLREESSEYGDPFDALVASIRDTAVRDEKNSAK